MAFAKGNIRWTISAANAFGVEVGELASRSTRASRRTEALPDAIQYAQTVEGERVTFKLDVNCMGSYDDGTARRSAA